MADLFWRQRKPGRSASNGESRLTGSVTDNSTFTKFEDQTKDAWDCTDDEVVEILFWLKYHSITKN